MCIIVLLVLTCLRSMARVRRWCVLLSRFVGRNTSLERTLAAACITPGTGLAYTNASSPSVDCSDTPSTSSPIKSWVVPSLHRTKRALDSIFTVPSGCDTATPSDDVAVRLVMVLRGLERGGVERAGLHAGDVGEAHELGGDVRGKGACNARSM